MSGVAARRLEPQTGRAYGARFHDGEPVEPHERDPLCHLVEGQASESEDRDAVKPIDVVVTDSVSSEDLGVKLATTDDHILGVIEMITFSDVAALHGGQYRSRLCLLTNGPCPLRARSSGHARQFRVTNGHFPKTKSSVFSVAGCSPAYCVGGSDGVRIVEVAGSSPVTSTKKSRSDLDAPLAGAHPGGMKY